MSIYPNAIDGFEQLPVAIDGITKINAYSVNNLREAILAIEKELGVRPSAYYNTVSDRLDALEKTVGGDLYDIENMIQQLNGQVSSILNLLGDNVSGGFSSLVNRIDFIESTIATPLGLITDSNLLIGSLVRVNNNGNIELASAKSLDPNNARIVGSSYKNYSIGETAELSSSAGKLISVRFSTPPLQSSNGSPVFLSETPGEGTLIPPNDSGTIIFLIGILQGADGISLTPNVVFQPKLEAYND